MKNSLHEISRKTQDTADAFILKNMQANKTGHHFPQSTGSFRPDPLCFRPRWTGPYHEPPLLKRKLLLSDFPASLSTALGIPGISFSVPCPARWEPACSCGSKQHCAVVLISQASYESIVPVLSLCRHQCCAPDIGLYLTNWPGIGVSPVPCATWAK